MKVGLEQLALAILNSLEAQIAVFDAQGAILYVNHSWISFGRANGLADECDWIGRNYLTTCLISSKHGDQAGAEVYAGIQAVIAGELATFAYEYPCHSHDEQRWFMMRVVPLVDLPDVFVASYHVITERKLAEERVERQNRELAKIAVTDRLTQLINRARFEEILDQEIERSYRYHSIFSVIMVDIDHFKRINDHFGHLLGDTVLMEFAQLLQMNVRKSDVAGRWGGEEFVVLLPESDETMAYSVAEKLRIKVAHHRFAVVDEVTFSYGVARYRLGQTPRELLESADSALYRAKRNGRNRGEIGV